MINNKKLLFVWPPILIYLLYLLSKLIWFDNITSMADDSVHYLVMARHYSPWLEESKSIATAWLLQDFPPLFPWVLALTGAAHSLLYAHLLVAAFGLVSLYLYYKLSCRWFDKSIWIVLPVIIFALSPGFILGIQGILSESLYLLFTLGFFLFYKQEKCLSPLTIIITSIFLSAILLTRTIGIALLLAVMAQAFFSSIANKKINYWPVITVVFSLIIYFLAMKTVGPVKESHYLDVLIRFLSNQELYEQGTSNSHVFSIQTQFSSLLNSWRTFWIIYWRDDVFSPSYAVMMVLLIMSMTGLLIRAIHNKLDAWYVVFYLMILMVWPHPGQMVRLLFPVMPLLLIYSGYAISQIVERVKISYPKYLLPSIFYIFPLVTVIPSHVFIHTRANLAAVNKVIPVYEIFRRADLAKAARDLIQQNQILSDFASLKSSVPEQALTMYFLPAYLAILSDRQGVKAPPNVDGHSYRLASEKNGVSYIFLTRLHPRNTHPDFNGLAGAGSLRSGTHTLWCSQVRDGTYISCLYKINKKVE